MADQRVFCHLLYSVRLSSDDIRRCTVIFQGLFRVSDRIQLLTAFADIAVCPVHLRLFCHGHAGMPRRAARCVNGPPAHRTAFCGPVVQIHGRDVGVHRHRPFSPRPHALENKALFYKIPCFCRRLKWSAIMAMNSELVGFPFIPLTV